ncbi:porin [Paraburkholderia terrae]
MRKTLIAVAAFIASGTAAAQSNVTLYGILDAGIAYVSNMTTRIGTPGARNFVATSGPQTANRWGLFGYEDLGGGTRALFRLENGFNIQTGGLQQGGREFGRQAYVGVANPAYGTLTLGRQYELNFDYVSSFTAAKLFATQWAAHVGDPDLLYSTFRLNNSVKYVTPTFGGLQLGALYAFSNQPSGENGEGFANNRAYSIGASWQGGPLAAAVGWTVLDNPSAGATNGSNTNGAVVGDYGINTNIFYLAPVRHQRILSGGVGYTLSKLTLNAVYSNVQLDYDDASFLHVSNYEVNAEYRITPALQFGAGYTFTDGRANGGNSTLHIARGDRPRWQQFDLGLDYSLSKRSDVYLVGIYQKAIGDAVVASLENSGGPSGSNSNQQIAVLAGLRHRF